MYCPQLKKGEKFCTNLRVDQELHLLCIYSCVFLSCIFVMHSSLHRWSVQNTSLRKQGSSSSGSNCVISALEFLSEAKRKITVDKHMCAFHYNQLKYNVVIAQASLVWCTREACVVICKSLQASSKGPLPLQAHPLLLPHIYPHRWLSTCIMQYFYEHK